MNFEFTEVMNDRQITLKYSIFDMMTQTFFVRLIWFDWDELEFKTFFFVLDYSTSIDHYFDSCYFQSPFLCFCFFFDFQKKTIQRGVTICFDYPLEMEKAFIAFFLHHSSMHVSVIKLLLSIAVKWILLMFESLFSTFSSSSHYYSYFCFVQLTVFRIRKEKREFFPSV